MNRNVILFAVVALVGFYLYQQSKKPALPSLPAPQASNPTGGTQVSGPQSTFDQVLGAITSIGNAVTSIAQQNTRSN